MTSLSGWFCDTATAATIGDGEVTSASPESSGLTASLVATNSALRPCLVKNPASWAISSGITPVKPTEYWIRIFEVVVAPEGSLDEPHPARARPPTNVNARADRLKVCLIMSNPFSQGGI